MLHINLQGFRRVEGLRQTEVDDLDLVAVVRDAEDVFWLDIEMKNAARMDVSDSFADLSHEMDAFAFGEFVIVTRDSFHQFTTADTSHEHRIEIRLTTIISTHQRQLS